MSLADGIAWEREYSGSRISFGNEELLESLDTVEPKYYSLLDHWDIAELDFISYVLETKALSPRMQCRLHIREDELKHKRQYGHTDVDIPF